MIVHIIFLITFAGIVSMTAYLSTTAEDYRRQIEKLKIEADFVKKENEQLKNENETLKKQFEKFLDKTIENNEQLIAKCDNILDKI
jgi:regulator of replication initiation timing